MPARRGGESPPREVRVAADLTEPGSERLPRLLD